MGHGKADGAARHLRVFEALWLIFFLLRHPREPQQAPTLPSPTLRAGEGLWVARLSRGPTDSYRGLGKVAARPSIMATRPPSVLRVSGVSLPSGVWAMPAYSRAAPCII